MFPLSIHEVMPLKKKKNPVSAGQIVPLKRNSGELSIRGTSGSCVLFY